MCLITRYDIMACGSLDMAVTTHCIRSRMFADAQTPAGKAQMLSFRVSTVTAAGVEGLTCVYTHGRAVRGG